MVGETVEPLAEDIAALMRDKIRLQAESVLNRVEGVEKARSTTASANASSVSLVEMGKEGCDVGPKTPPRTPLTTEYNRPSAPGSELSKRLQRLALERQKQSTDRLKVIQADTSSHLSSVKTFQELNLPTHLLEALFTMGFDRPSAIQEEALPRILADPPRNLIGQAKSGSGKTAAFTLGMLYRITVDTPATTQALCVTPTRELAIQIVDKAVRPMAVNMKGLKIQLAISQSVVDKKIGVDSHMVVGTPGKVVDWLKRRIINPDTINIFVLDEADNMVEEGGHRANSLLIKKCIPPTCQNLFFSATFPEEVVNFATKMVDNPDKILIEDGPEFLVLDVIKQLWVDTREYSGGKLMFLGDIYSLLTIGQSIIFVGTKIDADTVHTTLTGAGFTCSVLHGSVDAAQRDTTMEAFRNGESNVLITTNVLARGVDVDNVCMVINYDIPVDKDGAPDFETYLHRIGRTGRFGRKGTAINLISDQKSVEILAAIESHFAKGGEEMIKQAPADPETLADVIEI
jgi:ATP-dependent RNA helicase DDX19/DBP5